MDILSCFTRFKVLNIIKKGDQDDSKKQQSGWFDKIFGSGSSSNSNKNKNNGNFATEWEIYLETMEPQYKSYKQFERERNIREEFAINCTTFDFNQALKLCDKYKYEIPNLINSVRPSSSKCYTALHQASWQRNNLAIAELKKAGANPNVWNHNGQTPLQTYNAE